MSEDVKDMERLMVLLCFKAEAGSYRLHIWGNSNLCLALL